MRALTVEPGKRESACLEDVPEPPLADGPILVQSLALGICGTDREILSGFYGSSPPGDKRLILGHESLGRVLEAPRHSGLKTGDLVVGVVRRPDPLPCVACASGQWDMCLNGEYTERGIKERHGYGSERFRVEPEFAIKIDENLGLVGVLVEPASILAKAWDHVDRVSVRLANWHPETLLVTGAGPIGLLAALMGAQRGLHAHVFDAPFQDAKSALVGQLGGTYVTEFDDLDQLRPDIIMECTGSSGLVARVLDRTSPTGVLCLIGVPPSSCQLALDVGSSCRTLVLENHTIIGSVNANRKHYEAGARALLHADRAWLGRLVTRRVGLSQWRDALQPQAGDIKVVIEFAN